MHSLTVKAAKAEDYSPLEMQQLLADAWLNTNLKNVKVWNPLAEFPSFCEDNPEHYLTWVLMQPEYFQFICKAILNVEIYPMQGVILQTLWNHKFPLLIGARGLGKCISKDSIIFSNNGIKRISDYIDESAIPQTQYKIDLKLKGEQSFSNVDYCWYNGKTPTIKLTSNFGYKLEGTNNHPIRVLDNTEIVWKNLEDVKLGDYVLIDRSEEWFENTTNDIEADEAYLLGLIIGDGGYTQRSRISFTTADEELANSVCKLSLKYFGKSFTKQRDQKYTWNLYSVGIWDKLFQHYGFNSPVCGLKEFPSKILSASKKVMKAFIQGLMDTDGCVEKSGIIGFCAKSKKMVEMMQFVLTKFGIVSRVKPRFNKKYQRYYYHLNLCGDMARKFTTEINFRLSRKKNLAESFLQTKSNTNKDIIPNSLTTPRLRNLIKKYINHKDRQYWEKNSYLSQWHLTRYNLTYQNLNRILNELIIHNVDKTEPDFVFLENLYNKRWFFDVVTSLEVSENDTFDFYIPNDHSFISNGFISHNSWLLGLYAILRMILLPGRKLVITGAAFRQSKIIFEYMENFWNNSPLLRDMYGTSKDQGPNHGTDMWTFKLGRSVTKAIPMGNGDKIRGLRAHDTIADEMASINREIFETVVGGFSVVSATPIESMKQRAKEKLAKLWNIQLNKEDKLEETKDNQTIISGTAHYDFNHFADYWKKWHQIIISKDVSDTNLKYSDYAVIRIPIEIMPEGPMDLSQVARTKATVLEDIFLREYGAVFAKDSNGFFKRSILESCVCAAQNKITNSNGELITFHPALKGRADREYIIAIDPASEVDNFAIVVLELYNDHRRIVYAWTTNKKEFNERRQAGLTSENNFYAFTARKIRDLIKIFPCNHVVMDSQGGGQAVLEAMHDKDKVKGNEQLIWEIRNPDKPKITDGEAGLHIVELVNFADNNWVNEANHGLKKDFGDKVCLFPSVDAIEVAKAMLESDSLYDNMEDCIFEIEELKNELSIIIMTKTPTGKDKWDTPENKVPGMKKGNMTKDRYSALLMANTAARRYMLATPTKEIKTEAGWMNDYDEKIKGPGFQGPCWATDILNDLYD